MTDISTLAAETSRLLNFYQGAESTINTKLNQVLQADPKKVYKYYVDKFDGDDANDGLTEATAFRTLNKISILVQNNIDNYRFSIFSIYLKSQSGQDNSYIIDREIIFSQMRVSWRAYGINRSDSSSFAVIKFNSRLVENTVFTTRIFLYGSHISFRYINIETPEHTGGSVRGEASSCFRLIDSIFQLEHTVNDARSEWKIGMIPLFNCTRIASSIILRNVSLTTDLADVSNINFALSNSGPISFAYNNLIYVSPLTPENVSIGSDIRSVYGYIPFQAN